MSCNNKTKGDCTGDCEWVQYATGNGKQYASACIPTNTPMVADECKHETNEARCNDSYVCEWRNSACQKN
jgi:hypothetical protein